MAMNDYITLNGKKYKTSAKNWFPVPSVPSTARLTLNGGMDVTYGPGVITEWQGTILIPQTPAAGFGAVADFEAAVNLRAPMSFSDHYGNAYTVHLLSPGNFKRRSAVPKWDAASNEWYVDVRIVRA